MHRLTCLAAIAFGPLFLAGCGDASRPTDPMGETPAASRALVSGGSERLVNVKDACDPTTFNAVVGPGTCLRSGGVRFADFVAQLTRRGTINSWHFAPATTTVHLGQTLVAVNRGGEVHTFTQVATFGGGIVPFLNELARTPVVAPECTALDQDDFIPPGGTFREETDQAGTLQFECCIHPWMRTTVRVKDD